MDVIAACRNLSYKKKCCLINDMQEIINFGCLCGFNYMFGYTAVIKQIILVFNKFMQFLNQAAIIVKVIIKDV